MEEKLYEVSKGSNNKTEMTHSEVSKMLLSGGFMSMFNRMKIGEEMHYQDKMLNFKRLK